MRPWLSPRKTRAAARARAAARFFECAGPLQAAIATVASATCRSGGESEARPISRQAGQRLPSLEDSIPRDGARLDSRPRIVPATRLRQGAAFVAHDCSDPSTADLVPTGWPMEAVLGRNHERNSPPGTGIESGTARLTISKDLPAGEIAAETAPDAAPGRRSAGKSDQL